MNNTSIAGMKRTHMCGDLRLSDAGSDGHRQWLG